MPALPTFSVHDCRFLRRYESGQTPSERLPSADQTYLRDIRGRLQSLVQIAIQEYRGRVAMTDFASPLYPGGRVTGKYWAGLYPRLFEDEKTSKSSQLQLAVAIMPSGLEICFCRGSGKLPRDAADKLEWTKRQTEAVQSALLRLPLPLVARVERSLRPYWCFRKQSMQGGEVRDFATLTQWIEYAASNAGARASISTFIGVDELEKDKFDVGAMFLEANRLFEPLFEAVYGSEEIKRALATSDLQSTEDDEEPATTNLEFIASDLSAALRESNLVLGTNHDENIRAFLASLATKRFVILTGLSGSGKTQLALRFGEWLGIDRLRVTPVRPDWTGAEALFGYEDALQPVRDGARAWHVPEALEFLLRAANDPNHPYLLVLDEMNLAHVERYFADFLSGMETGQPCLPNLERGEDGHYRILAGSEPKLPMPTNLFVIGTVNIDETTYLFSPKVLDRANTIDFRVRTEDLQTDLAKPQPCKAGSSALVCGLLQISRDDHFQQKTPAPGQDEFASGMRRMHRILSAHHLEFGHRVFYEANRFAAMFAASGVVDLQAALDRQIMQKILPRLHGSRRKLEYALCALAAECTTSNGDQQSHDSSARFDPLVAPAEPIRMPLSFEKIQRMVRALRLNQFTSFSE
jgi:MoxR-like ATPase